MTAESEASLSIKQLTKIHSPPHSVSWLDQSHVKRTIAKYNGELDDFDLL